jgi:transposase
MLSFPAAIKVYLCAVPCDMRRSFDGLSMMAEHLIQCDPFSGHLLVFRSRHGTAIRILVYGGQGFWLAQKRLSKGRFRWWPEGRSAREIARSLEAHQLQVLLAAGDPTATRAVPAWRPVSVVG